MTASATKMWPLDPSPEMVKLDDIAHALSQICRWGGHCKHHYSVAQHAMTVMELVQRTHPHLALAALHHDSAEAYLTDQPKPVKRFCEFLFKDLTDGQEAHVPFDVVEHDLQQVIFIALNISWPTDHEWQIIKAADLSVLLAEAKELMPHDDWFLNNYSPYQPANIVIGDAEFLGGMSNMRDLFIQSHYAGKNRYACTTDQPY